MNSHLFVIQTIERGEISTRAHGKYPEADSRAPRNEEDVSNS